MLLRLFYKPREAETEEIPTLTELTFKKNK